VSFCFELASRAGRAEGARAEKGREQELLSTKGLKRRVDTQMLLLLFLGNGGMGFANPGRWVSAKRVSV
jgi:hypothetical protein